MIEITKYEQVQKGKIIGYVDILLTKWNLIIRRIHHLQSGDKRWFNFPSFPKEIEDSDSKVKYFPYVQFAIDDHNRRLFDKLSVLVTEYCEKNGIDIGVPTDMNLDEEAPF